MEVNKEELLKLRDEIDRVDSRITELYSERMDVCSRIADLKIKSGSKVFDPAREAEKIRRIRENAQDEFDKQALQGLFEYLMSVSRKLQYKKLTENGVMGRLPFICVDSLYPEDESIRVVFQGAQGSYSQAAMEEYFGKGVASFHVASFREAMSAIDEGSADFGVLPIENSTAGIVSEIYDLLAEFENYIVGQQIIPIKHCLLGLEDTDLAKVKKVYSHPQSLMQCSDFLSEYPWEQISMPNNAFAAERIMKENDDTQVAIASRYAGEHYGLKVLKEGINDSRTNSTRFIIITNQKVFLKGADRISICFELPHKSGSLYHILSHFIYNDLNMTRIESRPIPGSDWEYRFFVDFEGNLSDGSVKNALRGIRDEAKGMQILGNY